MLIYPIERGGLYHCRYLIYLLKWESVTNLKCDSITTKLPPWIRYLLACDRKVIETIGSLIEQLLPKHIHAVTAGGFELKVALFVLATSFNLFKVAT